MAKKGLAALNDDGSGNLKVLSTVGTGATSLGKAEDAAHVSGDTGVMALAVQKATAAATAAEGDYAPLEVDSSGRLHASAVDNGPAWTPVRALKSSSDASTISDLTAAPTSGLKLVLDDLWVSVDTAMRVDITEETSGTVLWSAYLPANGSVQFTPRDGLKLDTADKKARITASVAGNIRCIALYHSA